MYQKVTTTGLGYFYLNPWSYLSNWGLHAARQTEKSSKKWQKLLFKCLELCYIPKALMFIILWWGHWGRKLYICSSGWFWTHYVTQVGFELTITLLPLPPIWGDCKHTLPHWRESKHFLGNFVFTRHFLCL